MNINEARELIKAKVTASPAVDKSVPRRPETLYHYTSGEGLLGIVTSNLLRASNVLYMNDASELEYTKRLIDKTIVEKLTVGAVAPGRDFMERSAGDDFSFLSVFHTHIACFCESGDLLSQWRAYADHGGGYAIGFETLPLARPTDFLGCTSAADLLQVEYDPAVQRLEIMCQLDVVCDALNSAAEDHPSFDGVLVPAACMVFQERVAPLLFSYKHSAFLEEREWRLISLQPRDHLEQYRFRPGIGFLVPYVELDLHWRVGPNRGKLPISNVVIGPTLHPDLAKKSVELLLRKCGFHHVTITASEAPLRAQ